MIEQIDDLLKKRFPKYKHRDRYYEQVAQEIIDSLKHECEWVRDTKVEYHIIYKTGCGSIHLFNQELNFKYCPDCSGKIKEKA